MSLGEVIHNKQTSQSSKIAITRSSKRRGRSKMVFGGSSDIGEQIINRLPKEEWCVYATYYKNKKTKNAIWQKCDITDINQINEIYQNTENLDAVIFSSMPELTNMIQDIDYFQNKALPILNGHVTAYIKALENLNENGKIIILSGQSVKNGLPAAPYMAANFAYINNLNKSLKGNNPKKIQTCDILLGPVKTKMWVRLSEDTHEKYFANKNPDNYFMNKEKVAKKVLELLNKEKMPVEIMFDNNYSKE